MCELDGGQYFSVVYQPGLASPRRIWTWIFGFKTPNAPLPSVVTPCAYLHLCSLKTCVCVWEFVWWSYLCAGNAVFKPVFLLVCLLACFFSLFFFGSLFFLQPLCASISLVNFFSILLFFLPFSFYFAEFWLKCIRHSTVCTFYSSRCVCMCV